MKNPGLPGGEYPEKPVPDTDTLARAIRKANERSGMLTANTVLTFILAAFTGLLAWIGNSAITKLDTLNTTVEGLKVQMSNINDEQKRQGDEVQEHDRMISVMWDDRQKHSEKQP